MNMKKSPITNDKNPEFTWNLVKWGYAKNKIMTTIAVIIYTICPIDLIIDIPFVGWIDDGLIIICLLNEVKKDIDNQEKFD